MDNFSLDQLNLFVLGEKSSSQPVMVEVQLNGVPVRMEVDTGAAVTVLNVSCYERVNGTNQVLEESELRLKTYIHRGDCSPGRGG